MEQTSPPTYSQGNHMAADQYVDGTYLNKVPDWHEGDSPWKASQVLRMLTKHRLLVSSVYDLGCGVGELLVQLQRNLPPETTLIGFDISPQAISLAKSRENDNLKFRNIDFLSSEAPVPDLLLLLDVFEHVPDYIRFLEALRKRTAWVIFHIPIDVSVVGLIKRSSWMLHMRRQYGHLHYFTKQTALATLGDVGYKVVDCFYTDDLEIPGGHIGRSPLKRIYYQVRRLIFHFNQDLSSALFNSYNLMVLAQGDRSAPSISAGPNP